MSSPLFDEQSIKYLFERPTIDRIYRKDSGHCSFEKVVSTVSKWKQDGVFTVFTAGVFDMLHVNHLLALNHYRLLGARLHLQRNGNLTPTDENVIELAGSEKVKLIVTIDSDQRASKAKSYRPDKAYSPLSWESRAMMLANQYMGLSDGSGWPLVDLITQHGINSCICSTCPHRDNADMAIALNPDLLIVNSASSDTILKVRERISSRQLVILNENDLVYADSLLQGPIKSTAIITRAKL